MSKWSKLGKRSKHNFYRKLEAVAIREIDEYAKQWQFAPLDAIDEEQRREMDRLDAEYLRDINEDPDWTYDVYGDLHSYDVWDEPDDEIQRRYEDAYDDVYGPLWDDDPVSQGDVGTFYKTRDDRTVQCCQVHGVVVYIDVHTGNETSVSRWALEKIA